MSHNSHDEPMMESSFPPLILTLKLDRATFEELDHLRQQYFPRDRNFIAAHVTLFHALPGEKRSTISQQLQDLCSNTSVFPLNLPNLRFLGQGVAVEVDCPTLMQLHHSLVQQWHFWLSRQDQQGYRPHVTIQNKVAPNQARTLYDRLSSTWQPIYGRGEGLLLWYYQGGPWQLVHEFTFVDRSVA